MTVTTTATAITIGGNGVQTVFNYSFEIPYQDDGLTPAVQVALISNATPPVTTILVPSQYTITGVGNPAGGTVTYVGPASVPLPTGWFIQIVRNKTFTQPSAFPNSGFLPNNVEKALDTVVLAFQQLSGQFNSSVRGVLGETLLTLPNASARANKFLLFDNAGNPNVGSLPTQAPTLPFINILNYGADPTFTNDSTAAINAAISAAAVNGGTVIAPAGTYKVIPTQPIVGGAVSGVFAFQIPSNVQIYGLPGSIFKVANGVSSNGAPVNYNMFLTTSPQTNFSILGLTMDMNGANNLINLNHYQCAHVFCTGDAGRIVNCFIEKCQFLNTPGVTCIGMGQSNTVGITLGSGWRITNNLFSGNGMNSTDHSSIYGYAEDVVCFENTFVSQVIGTGSVGGLVAYEVHGTKQRFIGNLVINYYQGMWISSNLSNPVYDTIVTDNTFWTVAFGVAFFDTNAANVTQIYDTLIQDNTFYFDDSVAGTNPAGYSFKYAIAVIANTHQRVTIQGNRIYKTWAGGAPLYSAALCAIGGATSGKNSSIVVQGNQCFQATVGVLMQASSGTIGAGIVIRDNIWINLTTVTGTYAAASAGLAITAPVTIDQLTLGQDTIIDTRGTSQTAYGYYVSGTITDFTLLPYVFTNILTAEYTEASLTATKRRGQFLPTTFFSTFASLPTSASCPIGCQAWITDSNTVVFLANAAGGGANKVPLRNNGTNWVVA